ncbi:DUF2304 domain-containing protein [Candidatus Uhrbacteria bacterium]|nr:DUF2304 domain-containing protein [Candidatus Uhrbacteria bacterium]
MVIQILVTIASVFVIAKSVIAYIHKTIRIPTFIVWSIFWTVIIFLVWQPNLTDRLAAVLQVGRGADAIFYLSLIAVFYLLFKIFIRFENIVSQVTTLVREMGIIKKDIEDIKK